MLSADRAKLFRLLALTNSPYDGEALAASRMANKLLKRAGPWKPTTGIYLPRARVTRMAWTR